MGRHAVHADHLQVGMIFGQRLSAVPDVIALPCVGIVPAGKADPVIRSHLLGQIGLQQRLLQGGLGLDEQQVGPGVPQQLHPAGMELAQHLLGNAVTAPVFRAVCQIRAVGTDTGKAKGIDTALRLTLVLPPVLPHLVKNLHGADNQSLRLRLGAAVLFQARNRGLIAARNAAVRTGAEIVQMHLLHQLRLPFQRLRGPQGIVQIAAKVLQRCGHGTVDHQNAAGLFQSLFQRNTHFQYSFCS